MWDPISPVYSIRKKLLIISVFFKAEVPFTIPHKAKPKGRFNGKDNG